MYFSGPVIQYVTYNNERSRHLLSIYIGTAIIFLHSGPISNNVIHRHSDSNYKCYISASTAEHLLSNEILCMELRVV